MSAMKVVDIRNKILYSVQLQMISLGKNAIYKYACWSLVSLLPMWLYYKWREGPAYLKKNRIDGKVVIVTGSSTGIGKEIALELAKRGGRIYMACHEFEICERARQEIIQLSGNANVFNCLLDLSSLQSVRNFVKNFKQQEDRLDILINNAGILATPYKLTEDGYEQQFAINHLGHFLLTNLLMDKLENSAPSRIVVLSSASYIFGQIQKDDINSEKSYNAFKAYCSSKLANILFTRKLAKILRSSNIKVDVNCLHPGPVQSDITKNNAILKVASALGSKLLLRSTKMGAQTALYLALDPEVEGMSGGYYDRMSLAKLQRKAEDDEMADWLWEKSAEMVKVKTNN
ncbi:retinol dehydrogenase 13-like [Stomoxys calcitrans]|uniref:retinol dehydrogenase 13-like n=1 Tax=Stomoxys calcitrans TaxID=35570 RepID=UPI0027E3A204|nr:retinol dehydrogenase 13-like [Stomoxys calcitrans]